MDDIDEVTGGTSETDEKAITDQELRDGLLGGEANGVSYEVVRAWCVLKVYFST